MTTEDWNGHGGISTRSTEYDFTKPEALELLGQYNPSVVSLEGGLFLMLDSNYEPSALIDCCELQSVDPAERLEVTLQPETEMECRASAIDERYTEKPFMPTGGNKIKAPSWPF